MKKTLPPCIAVRVAEPALLPTSKSAWDRSNEVAPDVESCDTAGLDARTTLIAAQFQIFNSVNLKLFRASDYALCVSDVTVD